MEDILKEAIFLLGIYGPEHCPFWKEGVGDCGECTACRVDKCITDLEALASNKTLNVRKLGCEECRRAGRKELSTKLYYCPICGDPLST